MPAPTVLLLLVDDDEGTGTADSPYRDRQTAAGPAEIHLGDVIHRQLGEQVLQGVDVQTMVDAGELGFGIPRGVADQVVRARSVAVDSQQTVARISLTASGASSVLTIMSPRNSVDLVGQEQGDRLLGDGFGISTPPIWMVLIVELRPLAGR